MAGGSGGYLCLGLGTPGVSPESLPGGLGRRAPYAVVLDSECSLDRGDYSVVCGVASVSPHTVGIGSDDGLCVLDSVGEVPPCPSAGSDDGVESLLGVGSQDVVWGGADCGLNSGDVAGSITGSGDCVVVDQANAVPNIVDAALPSSDNTTVVLWSSSAPGGVSVDGVEDSGRVGRDVYDSDVLGDPGAVEVEGDCVAWADVPLVDENTAAAGFCLASGDVGGAPCDADGGEDPGDEHVAVGDAAGCEHVVADGAGVPSSVLGAIFLVSPSAVADFALGDAEDVCSCCHYLPPFIPGTLKAATPKSPARTKLMASMYAPSITPETPRATSTPNAAQ